ncbi:uncharacterized protein LOC135473313 [Liolophura sinensis]|uniref:uncharacterized protein LOC135473313 n=1 Tax=Liolophura sinensis TaxID=3198878 RepID=UPI0031589969
MSGPSSQMTTYPDVDSVFRSLGTWGRWQIFQLILIQLQYIAPDFHLLAIVFLGYEPPFSCFVVDNTTGLLEHNVTHYVQEGDCKVRNTWTNVTSPCHHGYWYDAPLETATIVTEGIVMTGSVLPLEIIPVEKRAIVHLLGTGT